MYAMDILYGFQFDNDQSVDEQIDPEDLSELFTINGQWHDPLSFDHQATLDQTLGENSFVHRLQHTWSDLAMHADGLIKHDAADIVDLHFLCVLCVSA